MNAAIWFGAAIFFTFGVAPTFFSPGMKALLGGTSRADAYAGLIAQMVLERYFVLNYWCGAVALAHLLAEWVYLGKAIHRWTLGILLGAFFMALCGGLWLQPKLRDLHLIRYAEEGHYTPVEKIQAARSFSLWHGVSQVMNLAVLGGLGIYVWRITHSSDAPRFVSASKFRS